MRPRYAPMLPCSIRMHARHCIVSLFVLEMVHVEAEWGDLACGRWTFEIKTCVAYL